ncbi:MAG TPA: transposase [Gemmatimonadaceae bacterium]
MAASELRTPAHPFYEGLEKALTEGGFDAKVEKLCAPFYSETWGRRSIPPGVYFRMVMVGYFEEIASERGIVWRCRDSWSLRTFLGLLPTEEVPDHSSLSIIRRRLDTSVFEAVNKIVLELLAKAGLIKGEKVAIDSTLIAANAAMRSIARKDTRETYGEFAKRLAQDAGEDVSTPEAVARADAKRKDKSVSNTDWESKTDPDAKIARMKDGSTHLAYKPEHAVDMETGAILATTVNPADEGDRQTMVGTIVEVERALRAVGVEPKSPMIVADKGYHSDEMLAVLEDAGYKPLIAEPHVPGHRRWTNKEAGSSERYHRNRRRLRSCRGKHWMRRRGEYVERSFAHQCDRGKLRRTYLRELDNVTKSYLMRVAGQNLGVLMRKKLGAGTPKALRDLLRALLSLLRTVHAFVIARFVIRHDRLHGPASS